MSNLLIEPGARVLFQGDSITDAGRNREDDSSLGAGYANFVAAWLSAAYPDHKLTFINRGIGGNTVPQLEERWDRDCIDLQPDWLSILIGINDCGREIGGDGGHTAESYEATYRRILDRASKKGTEPFLHARGEAGPGTDSSVPFFAKLIILEPFLLPGREDVWQEKLPTRIHAARAVARDYQAIYIPLDGLFAAASTRREPEFWSIDRVHPTQAGHALIAQAWIRAVGG